MKELILPAFVAAEIMKQESAQVSSILSPEDQLDYLINSVEKDTHEYVIVFMSELGIHWHGESESACDVMASIIGEGSKVMTRDVFLEGMKTVRKEMYADHS